MNREAISQFIARTKFLLTDNLGVVWGLLFLIIGFFGVWLNKNGMMNDSLQSLIASLCLFCGGCVGLVYIQQRKSPGLFFLKNVKGNFAIINGLAILIISWGIMLVILLDLLKQTFFTK
jgi:hypothetical protein